MSERFRGAIGRNKVIQRIFFSAVSLGTIAVPTATALGRVVDDDQGPDKSAFIVGDRALGPDSNTVETANLPTIEGLYAELQQLQDASCNEAFSSPSHEVLMSDPSTADFMGSTFSQILSPEKSACGSSTEQTVKGNDLPSQPINVYIARSN